MKKLFVALFVASFMVLMSTGTSFAICGQYVKIQVSYVSPTTGYFYGTPDQTFYSAYYYYWNTTDPDMIGALQSAHTSNKTVYVVGNAASCPGSPSIARYGGVVSYFYTYN